MEEEEEEKQSFSKIIANYFSGKAWPVLIDPA